MKINPLTVSKVYSSNTLAPSSSAGKQTGEAKSSLAKVDTISISAEGIRKNDISKLSKQIAADVYKETKPERISELKRQIANNEYNISSDKLADAILERTKL